MPPVKCCYFRCNNTSAQKSMFRFPCNHVERTKTWVTNCGNMTISHLPISKLRNRFICIDHFDHKYVRNENGQRKRLLKTAVPELYTAPNNINISPQGSDDDMEFSISYEKHKTKESTALKCKSYKDNTDSDQESSIHEHNDADCNEEPLLSSSEPPRKKIRSHTITTNNNPRTTYIPTRQEEDLRRMFLLSLLPEVAELTEPQMCTFRRDVFKLLDCIAQQNDESTFPVWKSNTNMPENDLELKSEPL